MNPRPRNSSSTTVSANDTKSVMTPWRARRLVFYFALFVALFTVLAIGGSRMLQSLVMEPACRSYGDARGLRFVSYSKGGGDLLNLGTSFSPMSCYYASVPNNVPFRDVADTLTYNIARIEGTIVVVGGLVLALLVVVGLAFGLEAAVRARRTPGSS